MDSLRLRFWGSAFGLLVVELAVIGAPMLALIRWPDESYERGVYFWMAVLVVLSLTIWHGVATRWFAPIYEARKRVAAGKSLDTDERAHVLEAILRLPMRQLVLRSSLIVCFAVSLAWLTYRAGLPRWDVFAALVLVTANGIAIAVFRASWHEWLLERPRRELNLGLGELELFRARYRPRLLRMALLSTVLALTFFTFFVYFFIPFTLEQYRFLQSLIPVSVFVLSFVWYLVAHRELGYVRRYFANPDSDDTARDAYVHGQAMPYRLATSKAITMVLALVSVHAAASWTGEIDPERTILCALTAMLIAMGMVPLESLLQRFVLRPFLEHLRRAHPIVLQEARSSWSLRRKMSWSFGGLTLFFCSFSLFWGFLQYRNLAQKFVQAEAEGQLLRLIDRLPGRTGEAGFDIDATRERLRGERLGAQAIYWLPEAGEPVALTSGPTIPSSELAAIRRRRKGWLELSKIGRQGAFHPVRREHPTLGQMIILLPGYQGRPPGLVGQLKAMGLFFFVIIGAGIAMVGLAVRELARPVRELETRAEAMALGDLESRVPLGAEADELGQLAVTLEEMRRSVNDKIAVERELQAGLEKRVEERTRDLQKSNKELRGALEALRVAQVHLVEQGKMAIVGQLVAGIAHEVNNPVNAMVNTIGPLEETLQHALDASGGASSEQAKREIRAMIGVIQRGADRTKKIVQALRSYARGDGEELTEFEVREVVDEAVELLRHDLRGRVELQRKGEDVGRVHGYPGQLTQVFLNLLANAVHAVADKPDGKIVIEPRRSGSQIEVVIKDNGPGIPEELRSRIFEPFFTTKPVGEGTGLGLSICQRIAERHGGTIRVDDGSGQGATFTVVLPQG